MMTQRKFVYFVAALFIAVSAASAEEIKIVSPSETENMEGNLNVGGGPSVRFQWLYPAADFMSVPSSHRTITGLAFRSDESNTFTGPVSGPARFLLSTITANELSTTYATNIGDDAIVVYDRMITWQTDDVGPGPREFDFVVPFDVPFNYAPSSGKNLVVDFIASEDWDNLRNWRIDGHENTTGDITRVASNPNARIGTGRARHWPTEFTFVPEPSTIMLATVGMLSLARWRRRNSSGV